MRTVHKYPIVQSCNVMQLPRGAQFRHLGIDPSSSPHSPFAALWFEVDTNETEITNRVFHAIGTGREIPARAIFFVGTIIVGHMVWHIYEEAF